MKRLLLSTLLAACSSPAWADTSASLEIFSVTISSQVVDGVATEVRQTSPLSSPVPGDRLTYRLTLSNEDAEPASDIELTLPLDESVTLVSGSLDGSLPATARYALQDGGDFVSEAELEGNEPTQVRLYLEALDAEASGTVEFDVLVK